MRFKGLHPEECTGDLVDLFGAARAWVDGLPFELYHRKALTTRRRRAPGEPDRTERGAEDGLALRLALPAPNGLCFAAGSGCEARTLRELVVRAQAGFGETGIEEPWPAVEASLVDVDPDFGLPEPGRSRLWLDEALERLAPIAERAGAKVGELSLEVAATVESWAASPGLRATRSRCRAFAVAELRPAGGSTRGFRPLRATARHWSALDPSAWARLLEDRLWPASAPVAPGGERAIPVLLNPEAAAAWLRLLPALDPSTMPAAGTGPLRMEDRPRDRDAPFGGTFDDCGESTDDRPLLPGALAAAAGRRRRASFRDPPRPSNAAPSLAPAPVDLPDRLFLATGFRAHPLGVGGISIELEGGFLERGRPGAFAASARVRTPLADWTERALGTVGPSRRDHLGTQTPAILFDDLRVEPRAGGANTR